MSSLESGYTAKVVLHTPSGDVDLGMWEGLDGTKLDSEDTKHRDAVTRKLTPRGGQRTRENATLKREGDAATWALHPTMEDSVGIDDATIVRQQIGGRGETIGAAKEYRGIFKSVDPPAYDLAGSEVGMFTIEIGMGE